MVNRPRFSVSALCLALVFIVCGPLEVKGDVVSATTVYVNGEIITLNDAQASAEAVAVRAGRILAVGSAAEVAAAAGIGAKTIDLEGRALLPGFIDSHGHFSMSAMYLAFENVAAPPVGPVENIADIQQILRAKKASTHSGDWILGRGYDEAYLEEGRHPNRFDLDKVSMDIPIALIHVSGHFMTCNSKCLEIAGIDASTEDPEGGVIRRVEGGSEPNGVLDEQAMYKLLPHLPIHDVEKFLALIGPAQDYYASFGITTLQDGFSQKSDLQLFDLAAEQGLFKLDLIAYPSYKLSELLAGPYSPSREYSNHWRVGGVKLGLDGSPQGKTAYLTEPYLVAPPGQDGDYRGYPTWHRDSVLGTQRAARISPVKSTLDRDMVYTLHNDAPVVPPDMLRLVWTAVNRVTRSDKVLGPRQRISVLDALKGITIHAAYQNFEEHIKGSIEPGKLADLVILSKNPLAVDPMTIKDIQVLETIKEGEPVYHAD